MPIISTAEQSPALAVAGFVAAPAGLRVLAYATADIAANVPSTGSVVAWAQVIDPDAAGGMRLDPVFLAAGRTWTPDQFRAAYGAPIELKVAVA